MTARPLSDFKYLDQAELFSLGNWRSRAQRVRYKRFASAAEAIQFAIEELGREGLAGIYLETDDQRFDGPGIRLLYESVDYPLARRRIR